MDAAQGGRESARFSPQLLTSSEKLPQVSIPRPFIAPRLIPFNSLSSHLRVPPARPVLSCLPTEPRRREGASAAANSLLSFAKSTDEKERTGPFGERKASRGNANKTILKVKSRTPQSQPRHSSEKSPHFSPHLQCSSLRPPAGKRFDDSPYCGFRMSHED